MNYEVTIERIVTVDAGSEADARQYAETGTGYVEEERVVSVTELGE